MTVIVDGEQVSVEALVPYHRNARRGNLAVLRESLAEHGQYRPVVVNRRTSEVLVGNHTVQAARELGWESVAVTWVDVDEQQAAKIVLVDNRSSDLATYDDDLLADLLREVPDLVGTGFDTEYVDDFLLATSEQAPLLQDPDEAPPVPDVPVSRPGDVWVLGEHRLAVGDCQEAATYEALLGGERPVCVWTDPPYGVDYVGKTAEALTIRNDSAGGLEWLLREALTAAASLTVPGASWYVAAPAGPQSLAFTVVLAELSIWRQTLVWVKSAMVLGHSDYHYKHEYIFTGYTPGYEGRRGRGGLGWYGDNSETSVLEYDKPSASRLHPTMKPVALIERCLSNSAPKGGLVLDPFAGSGSTLIAAHLQGMRARLIELDPLYADVICRRYQDALGDQPVLESTGEAHDFR